MPIQIETFDLPESWACAFMYGDESGLSDEESAAIDALGIDGFCVDVETDESGDFRRWHDASHVYPYASNVARYHFHMNKESAQ